MSEDRQYTLAEAQTELSRRECLERGHSFSIVSTFDGFPISLTCDRCGWSGSVTSRTEDQATFQFVVFLTADELDGGFVAEVEGFPGCLGQGETPQEAAHAAMDALHDILELRFDHEMKRQLGPAVGNVVRIAV